MSESIAATEPQHVPTSERTGHLLAGPAVDVMPIRGTDAVVFSMEGSSEAWLQTDTLWEVRQ